VLWKVRGHYDHVHVEYGRASTLGLRSLHATRKALGPGFVRSKANASVETKGLRRGRMACRFYRAEAGTVPMTDRK
jgi:hypothetical protein